jgi:hypothetical protein
MAGACTSFSVRTWIGIAVQLAGTALAFVLLGRWASGDPTPSALVAASLLGLVMTVLAAGLAARVHAGRFAEDGGILEAASGKPPTGASPAQPLPIKPAL